MNLFPATLLDAPTDQLLDLLLDGIEPGRLCVELSEQRFLGEPSYLREHGVRVGIDDVGYGRSSIEALLILEPDVVKVDRRCIQSVPSRPGERRRLERLMAMLTVVGAQVVVEGVETDAELAVLRRVGVRYAQGFLWDPPTKVRGR